MNIFCSKNKIGVAKNIQFQTFYSIFFHVFLVKVLKEPSIDENRNMHVLFKTILYGIVQSLQIFLLKQVWLLTLVKDILCLET